MIGIWCTLYLYTVPPLILLLTLRDGSYYLCTEGREAQRLHELPKVLVVHSVQLAQSCPILLRPPWRLDQIHIQLIPACVLQHNESQVLTETLAHER